MLEITNQNPNQRDEEEEKVIEDEYLWDQLEIIKKINSKGYKNMKITVIIIKQ